MLHDPELFEGTSAIVKEATYKLTKKFAPLMKWSGTGQDTVMDLGCGPGHVLTGIFLPSMAGKYGTVHGVDNSKAMVDYCRKKYAHLKNLVFHTLNLMDRANVLKEIGQVDHCVSSYTLHNINDQLGCFQNIYDYLKPGGDMFVIVLSKNPLFNAYLEMEASPKWGQYLTGLSQHATPFQNAPDARQRMEDVVRKAGFQSVVVDQTRHPLVYKSVEEYKVFLKSVLPLIKNIPTDMVDDLLNDLYELLLKWGDDSFVVDGAVHVQMELLTVYGLKATD